MRRQKHNPARRVSTPPRLLKRLRAALHNLSVYNRREFVYHNSLRLGANKLRKPCSELFSAWQYPEQSEPRRNVAEFNIGKRACHFVEIAVRTNIVNDRFVRAPVRRIVMYEIFAKNNPAYLRFPRAGQPDYHAYLPASA